MLATLFDVPQEDRHKLIYWSDTVENIGNPDVFETPQEAFQELWKCFEYFDAVWKERAGRSKKGSDLISILAQSEASLCARIEIRSLPFLERPARSFQTASKYSKHFQSS